MRFVLGVLSLYSMSGDASGKPTPSYKEILRSKDKDVREANTLLKGKRKNQKKKSVYLDTLSNGQKLVSKLRSAGD